MGKAIVMIGSMMFAHAATYGFIIKPVQGQFGYLVAIPLGAILIVMGYFAD